MDARSSSVMGLISSSSSENTSEPVPVTLPSHCQAYESGVLRRLRSASASAVALIHSGCSSMTSRYVVWHMKRPSSPGWASRSRASLFTQLRAERGGL